MEELDESRGHGLEPGIGYACARRHHLREVLELAGRQDEALDFEVRLRRRRRSHVDSQRGVIVGLEPLAHLVLRVDDGVKPVRAEGAGIAPVEGDLRRVSRGQCGYRSLAENDSEARYLAVDTGGRRGSGGAAMVLNASVERSARS